MDMLHVVAEIEKADTLETDMLLEAVIKRKRALYPQWDIFYLALPKTDWDKRERILEAVIRLERKMREDYEDPH